MTKFFFFNSINHGFDFGLFLFLICFSRTPINDKAKKHKSFSHQKFNLREGSFIKVHFPFQFFSIAFTTGSYERQEKR